MRVLPETPGEWPEFPLPTETPGEHPQFPTPTAPGPASSPPAPVGWAVGTFYGLGPAGERIVLTITSAGTVTANINGGTVSGNFVASDRFQIDGNTARLEQTAAGIATIRTDNGQRIDYSRSGFATGSGSLPVPTGPNSPAPAPVSSPKPASGDNSDGDRSGSAIDDLLGEFELDTKTVLIGGGIVLALILLS